MHVCAYMYFNLKDYAPDAETLVSYLDVAFSDEGLEKGQWRGTA